MPRLSGRLPALALHVPCAGWRLVSRLEKDRVKDTMRGELAFPCLPEAAAARVQTIHTQAVRQRRWRGSLQGRSEPAESRSPPEITGNDIMRIILW